MKKDTVYIYRDRVHLREQTIKVLEFIDAKTAGFYYYFLYVRYNGARGIPLDIIQLHGHLR